MFKPDSKALPSALLLALILLFGGCAHQLGPVATDYSGSQVDTATAISRSSFVVVGRILASRQRYAPGNTFFSVVRCTVEVVQSMRGQVSGEVPVSYLVNGQGVQPPFRVGDLCVFCITVQSLADPGVYMAGKILPATAQNIALVKQETAR